MNRTKLSGSGRERTVTQTLGVCQTTLETGGLVNVLVPFQVVTTEFSKGVSV